MKVIGARIKPVVKANFGMLTEIFVDYFSLSLKMRENGEMIRPTVKVPTITLMAQNI